VTVRLQSAVLEAPRPLNRLTDAAGFCVSLRMRLPRAIPQPMHHEANPPGAPGAAQRNSGGGIAPAAIGALIEAGFSSVNAFRFRQGLRKPPCRSGKPLKRLNIRSYPIIGTSGATTSEA
jgi:hypothetical protein